MNQVRFGAFDLDLETGELRRRGRIVRLPPKPLQVLALLVRSRGRLVSRETIRREVWGMDTYVDFEHALNFSIRTIREALKDNAQKPRYIETLPRRGYRFIAETASETPGASSGDPSAKAGDPRIEAYNCYSRGRARLTQAGKDSLEAAREDFEAAIALEPGYARAHSGLGAVHALRVLNRRDPEDLAAAASHLERARELDPELAEPYPWLCFVRMRKNELGPALAAGHRAVQMQPDLAHAHYFLGLAYFVSTEADASHYASAVLHLLDAGRADPNWQATWFVLSYAALLTGDYDQSERYAGQLLEMGSAGRGLPFIGAEIMLASVKLKHGEAVAARSLLAAFLERMASCDHMYRDAMSAAASCTLGDVELRYGTAGDSLAAYRRAWHTVQEHPRIAAYQRLSARAQSGLAAAYAAAGEEARARDLLSRAARLASESELPEHAAAAASLSELYWSLATAAARLADLEQAFAMLQNAVKFGWCDARWMENDPELGLVRSQTGFRSLTDTVRRVPKPRFLGHPAVR
jgi:DNA-binding winged helix-turn-helix (wHTH) protein